MAEREKTLRTVIYCQNFASIKTCSKPGIRKRTSVCKFVLLIPLRGGELSYLHSLRCKSTPLEPAPYKARIHFREKNRIFPRVLSRVDLMA